MAKNKNSKIVDKGKIIFTDQLKDQIFSDGAKHTKELCEKQSLEYPIGESLGHRIDQVTDILESRIGLAEWCLAHGQSQAVYKEGLKELGL